VRQLDHDGLITRQSDPQDGRCTIAALSQPGRTLLTDARGRAQAFLADRVAGLPDLTTEQINNVAGVLERVAVRPHADTSGMAGAAT
jgi:DNA-binding MarR family transcriptional regulator